MPFPLTVDLTTLGTKGFVIQGDADMDRAGRSVSSAGDVNGDGIDDVILGAIGGDDGGDYAGEAYVIFGSTSPVAGGRIDLATLTAAQGFVIQGDAAEDRAGLSVSSAGDINGDGIDDLILGGPMGDDGGADAGEAYVVFGTRAGFGSAVDGRQVIDLTGLTAVQGFIIQGDAAKDYAGWSVSDAGDVNGDGLDDLIVGAESGDDGGDEAGNGAGEAYIVFGTRAGFGTSVGGRRVLDLTGLTAAQGFIIQGDAAADGAGSGVASAGDVNGDGIDDLIVGASGGDDGGSVAGEAYIVFGSRAGFGTSVTTAGFARRVIDLTGLTAAQGFIIQGDTAVDSVGNTVASAGDVNGDGIDDLIVGAKNGDDGGSNAGEAYVVFGTTAGFGALVGGRRVIDLTSLTAAQGFVIQGDAAGDRLGCSVSAAGDINGDGLDDLIVGAYRGANGGYNAGEAYVIYGTRTSFGAPVVTEGFTRQVLDLTGFISGQGLIIQGDVAGDQAGFGVSAAGDVNGDGIDDVIVGASNGQDGGYAAGEAYVVYGQAATTNAPFPLTIDLTNLAASDGFVIQGDADSDAAGYSVSSAGDINGDGIDDVIVGARDGDDGGANAGEAYVVFGTRAGFGSAVDGQQVIDLTGLTAAQGFVIQGDTAADQAGRAVSSAGDVNGDGIDDMIVGATMGDDGGSGAGEAYVVFGTRAGFGSDVSGRQVIDLTGLTAAQGFIIQGDASNDYAGTSVSSAGDVNGDGFDDLIVGAQGGDDGGSGSGEAYVVFGGAGGFGSAVGARQVIDLTSLSAAQGFIIQGDAAGDHAGRGVSSAGDVNGDGIDDVIVGADGGEDGGSNAGEAYVVFGTRDGFGATVGSRKVVDLTSLTGAQGFVIQGDFTSDQLGWGVSDAGDVNGDGIDDLIVGAISGDDGGINAGEAYVVFGTRGGFGTTVGSRQVIDLTSLSAAQGFVIQADAAGDVLGRSVSSAGDVNGDGIDDLIVGAYGGDNGGDRAGEAYVIFGTRAGFGTEATVGGFARQVLDLTALTRDQGFIIQGDGSGDETGFSVSGAGDVDGDGVDDLIVSASHADGGGTDAGGAYVIFGRRVAPNTAPVQSANNGLTLAEGATATITAVRLDFADAEQADTAIVYTVTTAATNGVLLLNGSPLGLNGTFTQDDINNNRVTYLHYGGEAPSASFGFSVSDGAGGTVTGQSFTITVTPIDDAPVAADDLFLTDEITPATGDLFADNGEGADRDDDGDPLVITAVNGSAANIGIQITLSSGALLIVNADGTFSYDPNGTFEHIPNIASGATNLVYPDSFTYSLGTDIATVTIDMTGVDNDDLVIGGSANDVLNGGIGTNTLSYVFATAGVFGNIGTANPNDTVGAGIDTVSNFQNLTGSDYVDELRGSMGDNIIDGGLGADVMLGWYGNDTFIVDNADDSVRENAGQGDDTVRSSVTYVLPDREIENLTLTGIADINGSGNDYNNVLTGNSGVNWLGGYAGDDRIDGGAGADVMKGGMGDDTYVVDDAADRACEWDGQGTDTIETWIDFTLPGIEIENIVALGSAAINLTGNALGNQLTGNGAVNWLYGADGNDRIDGGAGADVMAGGTGDDVFVVDNAGDQVRENAGQGTDRVESLVSFSLQGLDVENLTLLGEDGISGTGNSYANEIHGNDGANLLLGYEGTDRLQGGDGDDELHGMTGHDQLEGGAGADGFYFDATLDAATNIDAIADFEVGVDSIQLRQAKFDGMMQGVLAAGAFVIGTQAADAGDRIIYDAATGALYFDADGTGATAAVQFATLATGLSLSAADFAIY